MLNIRKAEDRGRSDMSWLESKHTFSFADYHDPIHMGHGKLRVINDDTVAPGGGFGTHPHRDMEIISYVIEGSLEHKDSMGNSSVIRPGDVQRMTAGTGVRHSEWNHSDQEPVKFLQIWILPDRRGHQPGYEQKHFMEEEKRGRFRLVASQDGRESSVSLNQEFDMYVALIDGDEMLSHLVGEGRNAWVHVVRGRVTVNGEALKGGDGFDVSNHAELSFTSGDKAEVIIFDMAA